MASVVVNGDDMKCHDSIFKSISALFLYCLVYSFIKDQFYVICYMFMLYVFNLISFHSFNQWKMHTARRMHL